MMTSWVLIAILSAILTSLRQLQIKRSCSERSSELVIFATRLTGAVILSPVAFIRGIDVGAVPTFTAVTALTVIITAFATIIQVRLLQKEDISKSVPYMSFIPVFMLPWMLLLLGERPGAWALGGILLTSAGAYLINLGTGSGLLAPFMAIYRSRTARLMLIVAICLAFNTVLDKIAISSASAFTYVYIWTVSSTIVMGLICLRHPLTEIRSALTDRAIIIQALFWVGGYSCQIFAIRAAFAIQSGTTYVRALTLLTVLFTVIGGGRLFRERHLLRKSIATLCMVGGSIIIVLSTI